MAASLIAPMASSLIQPVASSFINAIIGKRTRMWISSTISITFNDEGFEKEIQKQEEDIK